MSARSRRPGLSLVEVLMGAVIIGVSALPILELIRSGTASLEVNEIDAAARQLASDVLERLCGPNYGTPRVPPPLRAMLRSPAAWRDFVSADPALAYGYPVSPGQPLARLLDTADVRVTLEEQSPFTAAAVPGGSDLAAYTVTVSWSDRNDQRKKVKIARIVDR